MYTMTNTLTVSILPLGPHLHRLKETPGKYKLHTHTHTHTQHIQVQRAALAKVYMYIRSAEEGSTRTVQVHGLKELLTYYPSY